MMGLYGWIDGREQGKENWEDEWSDEGLCIRMQILFLAVFSVYVFFISVFRMMNGDPVSEKTPKV